MRFKCPVCCFSTMVRKFPVHCICGATVRADDVPDEPPTITVRGVGTILKRLLATFGIHETADCQCASLAKDMDARGVDWCEANIDSIIGWMRTESKRRCWPVFSSLIAARLVRYAIRKARREQKEPQ